MWVHARFLAGAAALLPLTPWLVRQGRWVRATVPQLPEAIEPEGVVGSGDRSLRLVGIGESTIAGVGVRHHSEGLMGATAATLADRLGATVHWATHGRGGYTAAMTMNELVDAASHRAADVVVIGLGANDTFKVHPTWVWQRDVRRLIRRLRAVWADAPVVFAQVPPVHEFPALPQPLRGVLAELARLHGEALADEVSRHERVFYDTSPFPFDAVARLASPPLARTAFFADGVHPNAMAYEVWGRTLGRFLSGLQAVRERARCAPAADVKAAAVR